MAGGGRSTEFPRALTDVCESDWQEHLSIIHALATVGSLLGATRLCPPRLCRYENPEQKDTGRVWVLYENGHEAPLEPRLGAGYMSALG